MLYVDQSSNHFIYPSNATNALAQQQQLQQHVMPHQQLDYVQRNMTQSNNGNGDDQSVKETTAYFLQSPTSSTSPHSNSSSSGKQLFTFLFLLLFLLLLR